MPSSLRDLGDPWRAAEALSQFGDRRSDAQVQLLRTPRDADRPRLVAKMALELALDRGGGEGRELEPPPGVETLDGLEEPHRRDLHEVVDRLAAVRVPPGEVGRERAVRLDELVARPSVPLSGCIPRTWPGARRAMVGPSSFGLGRSFRRVEVRHTIRRCQLEVVDDDAEDLPGEVVDHGFRIDRAA